MPIRCAVAGLNRGSRFVQMLQENPHCEVVAVCDPRPDKLAQMSGIQGFEAFDEMLDKASVDMVAIITPGPLHAPQSIAALQAGCHVLVETPNVYSIEQATAVVQLARGKGLKYMLAEDYVYMGWCRRAAQAVESGTLGDIIGATGEYTHDCRGFVFADEDGNTVPFSRAQEPGIRPLWRLTDLPPLTYSSHTLGPLLELMDDRCITASGVCGGRHEVAGLDVFPLEFATLTTQKGAVVNLTNGFILGHPLGFAFSLYGTEGSLRITNTGTPQAFVASDAQGSQWQELPMPWQEREDGRPHVQVMVDEFVDSLVNDTSPPFDEARSMDFCLPGVVAHESARQGGTRIDLPLF